MNTNTDYDLDKKRINTLLNINSILIEQCTELQKTLHSNDSSNNNLQATKENFQNYIKRVHSNLTMLATINEKYSNPISVQQKQQFPQIMTPPPQLPQVFELYQQLQNLYPEGVQFYQKKLQQLRQQQQQQSQTQQHQQQQQQQQGSQGQVIPGAQQLSPQQVLARANRHQVGQDNSNNTFNLMHMTNGNNSPLW